MHDDRLVLRTVYVDPDVDDLLRDRAGERGASKAGLFRAYLQAGMKAVKAETLSLDPTPLPKHTLVLRTCHLDPKVDNELRIEAFDMRTSKNDLIRRYVLLGMRVEAESQKQLKPVPTERRLPVAAPA